MRLFPVESEAVDKRSLPVDEVNGLMEVERERARSRMLAGKVQIALLTKMNVPTLGHSHQRRDGYTQEAIGEMFGVDKGQIGYIGALERTERIVRNAQEPITIELVPGHEQVLRKAPKPLQVVLTPL